MQSSRQAVTVWGKRAENMPISEILQINIMKMDLMSDEELKAHLKYPRHQIVISEKLREAFDNESRKELRRNPGDVEG
ncbi:hypothetical protein PSCICO_32000 [Pseudomonas cichorii]|uniref:hypothetical protein n=1 Tax=Pseudomonas cichorii TaxID=36746 RepID=UPI0019106A34|nr:hypothetical protein [Pseudomonas cichorii]GFM87801.1 hypothetical protein PSCICO_32000 [Pseudomonas cichorii]